jgi:hypothetical protein
MACLLYMAERVDHAAVGRAGGQAAAPLLPDRYAIHAGMLGFGREGLRDEDMTPWIGNASTSHELDRPCKKSLHSS